MNRPWLIGLALILLVSNLFCIFIEGSWLGAEDSALMSALTGGTAHTAGGMNLLALGWSFLTVGLPALITWNFSFLGGGLSILKYILMAVTIGTLFGIAMEFTSAVSGLFGRR